jgi:hypothetical protein
MTDTTMHEWRRELPPAPPIQLMMETLSSMTRQALLPGFLAAIVVVMLLVRGQTAYGSEETSEVQAPACNAPPRAEPPSTVEELSPVTAAPTVGGSTSDSVLSPEEPAGIGSTGPGKITAVQPVEKAEPPSAEELARREAILKGVNLSPSWPPEKTQAKPSPPRGPQTAPQKTPKGQKKPCRR